MLLTAGMDGGVKLFDILQQRPLHVFYPPVGGSDGVGSVTKASIADISWSFARPLVFACAPEFSSGKDEIYIYDLTNPNCPPRKKKPISTISLIHTLTKSPKRHPCPPMMTK